MRAIILSLCFVLIGAAADRESITLTDGRTLVGYYDEDRGSLILDGGKVTLQISPDTIKARGPATTPPPVVVGRLKSLPKTAGGSEQPEGAGSAPIATDRVAQTAALLRITSAVGRSLDPAAIAARNSIVSEARQIVFGRKLTTELDSIAAEEADLRRRADELVQKKERLKDEWLASLRYRRVERELRLSDDPTKSESARAARALRFNNLVAENGTISPDALRAFDSENLDVLELIMEFGQAATAAASPLAR